jgi:hypothetical protein
MNAQAARFWVEFSPKKIGGGDFILAATGFWLQPYFALCL